VSSKNKEVVARNEAAKRLGIPVCGVCSEPACSYRNEHALGLRNALLCDRCYIDFLRREVRRELREAELPKRRVSVEMISEHEDK
jgi:hypothetical protein